VHADRSKPTRHPCPAGCCLRPFAPVNSPAKWKLKRTGRSSPRKAFSPSCPAGLDQGNDVPPRARGIDAKAAAERLAELLASFRD
jgi:hypothetical protein